MSTQSPRGVFAVRLRNEPRAANVSRLLEADNWLQSEQDARLLVTDDVASARTALRNPETVVLFMDLESENREEATEMSGAHPGRVIYYGERALQMSTFSRLVEKAAQWLAQRSRGAPRLASTWQQGGTTGGAGNSGPVAFSCGGS